MSSHHNIGIDKIAFYTPNFYISLKDLAISRNVDPNKFLNGLGQTAMSVIPPDEDIVTMAAAAIDRLNLESYENIDWLIITTETGVDHSKSAALYVHRLLQMPHNIKVVEMKQACAAGAAALDFAIAYVKTHPTKKVLIVNSDFSRYGLKSKGESSQGAAAVALLITQSPKIMSIKPIFGVYSDDIMDFWRPNYLDEAIVDGKYSCMVYLSFLEKAYSSYINVGGTPVSQLDAYCLHTPFPKLVHKAYDKLMEVNNGKNNVYQVGISLAYTALVGNCYTASLFLALISLLDSKKVQDHAQIGMYSYGSGSTAMFFSGNLRSDYQNVIDNTENLQMLNNRILLTITEYEEMYNFQLPTDGSNIKTPSFSKNCYRLSGMRQHKRIYQLTSSVN